MSTPRSAPEPESAYAWTRLFVALVLSAIGGVGMWSVIVALPAVQAEFGAARGAQMLSLMLAAGIVSRLLSGWICDHIGGRRTLLLGSSLQALALVLFLPFDGLTSLYVVSGLFGLFQGGIVPSYAVIIREFFPPGEAGVRVSTVLTATVFGMALGGWMTGVIYDLTGSYQAAFVNGILWNLLNIGIALGLLRQPGRPVQEVWG